MIPKPPLPKEYDASAKPDPLKAPLVERYAGLKLFPMDGEELLELAS
jgi:hypothetical protein